MKLLKIEKANYPHKFVAIFSNGKRTAFGYSPMKDYTQHHDEERRRLYRLRHKRDLETHDPTKAGFLSYYILWGDSTDMNKNIVDYKHRFNL